LENVVNKIIKEIEGNDSYFETAVETVNSYGGNFNFLINGDQIIVYFPLYEIAPYAAGIQGFTFTLEELAQDLKPEITNAMEGQEPKEILYLQREP
ncbi:MAG: RsiV family protein, partial [Eubacteriales bacterium]|nr:RsiV family protein [Eubacteriales bacterium]